MGDRVLKTRLGVTVHSVDVRDCITSSKVSDSARYGMSTKYLTTNYSVQADDAFEIPHVTDLNSPIFNLVSTDGERRPSGGPTLPLFHHGSTEELDVESAFIIGSGSKVSLYAWLSQKQFDRLRLTQHDENVKEWFGNLEIPDSALKRLRSVSSSVQPVPVRSSMGVELPEDEPEDRVPEDGVEMAI